MFYKYFLKSCINPRVFIKFYKINLKRVYGIENDAEWGDQFDSSLICRFMCLGNFIKCAKFMKIVKNVDF
jgi:hypothetical protein